MESAGSASRDAFLMDTTSRDGVNLMFKNVRAGGRRRKVSVVGPLATWRLRAAAVVDRASNLRMHASRTAPDAGGAAGWRQFRRRQRVCVFRECTAVCGRLRCRVVCVPPTDATLGVSSRSLGCRLSRAPSARSPAPPASSARSRAYAAAACAHGSPTHD